MYEFSKKQEKEKKNRSPNNTLETILAGSVATGDSQKMKAEQVSSSLFEKDFSLSAAGHNKVDNF